jgi:hypothetical protein
MNFRLLDLGGNNRERGKGWAHTNLDTGLTSSQRVNFIYQGCRFIRSEVHLPVSSDKKFSTHNKKRAREKITDPVW